MLGRRRRRCTFEVVVLLPECGQAPRPGEADVKNVQNPESAPPEQRQGATDGADAAHGLRREAADAALGATEQHIGYLAYALLYGTCEWVETRMPYMLLHFQGASDARLWVGLHGLRRFV